MRLTPRATMLAAAAAGLFAFGAPQLATIAHADPSASTEPCLPLAISTPAGNVVLPYVAGSSCSDTVIFTGHATVTPDVQLAGGGGSFSFTTATCDGYSDPEVNLGVVEHSTCTITASGIPDATSPNAGYANTVCGTGTAEVNSLTTTGLEGAKIDDSPGDNPKISFTGGQGTFTGGALATDDPVQADGSATDEAIDSASTVSLSVGPNDPDPNPPGTNCVKGFGVSATINLDEPTSGS